MVTFEENELPPLYLDMAQPGSKPKWKLVWGVGPSSIELHRGKGPVLYKPSLKQAGIVSHIAILPSPVLNE